MYEKHRDLIRRYVSVHTRVMKAYIDNYGAINKGLMLKYGAPFVLRPTDVIWAISELDRGVLADINVQELASSVDSASEIIRKLKPADVEAVVATRFWLNDVSGAKKKSDALSRIIDLAPKGSVLEFSLAVAREVVIDGESTIYDLKYLIRSGVIPQNAGPDYLGDELIDQDAIGGVAGGIGGAVSGAFTGAWFGGVGSGPGAIIGGVGGAVGGALAGSIAVLLEWSMGKGSFNPLGGYPYPHGPSDPNGPIGQGGSGQPLS